MIKSISWDHIEHTVTIESDQAFGGSEVDMLQQLRSEIDADLERRDNLVDVAKMAVYRAAADICRKYNVELTVEVTG